MFRKVFFLSALSLLIIIAPISFAWGSVSEKDFIGKWIFNKVVILSEDSIGKIDLMATHNLQGTTLEFFPDKTYLLKEPHDQDNGSWVLIHTEMLDTGTVKMTSKYGDVNFAEIKVRRNDILVNIMKLGLGWIFIKSR